MLGLLLIFVEHLELLPRLGLLRAGNNTLVSSPNTRCVGHEPLLGSEIPDGRMRYGGCRQCRTYVGACIFVTLTNFGSSFTA